MLYLASKSPRRKELLEQIQIEFSLVDASINEQVNDDESAVEFVCRMAKEKAQAGWEKLDETDSATWVLGSDTVVVCADRILGKPKDFTHSKEMLQLLSGNQHQVITAISIVQGNTIYTEYVSTAVYFRDIPEAEIVSYWQSNEPQDKAGSYGIQGIGGKFVKRIEGSYSAVVGLPLYETEQLLNKANTNFNKGIQ
ncbi:Maf family protein [Thalassomonas sp. M1454]|uniref:Maf family protein n=1 Tax=Thalassomonas sp. M1454 TaxID=2594477 RepID=UPI0011808785|nr:Maf family protein [Thalassomonas sp. M1454]TRX52795.1 septum formation inhibitor Maf [Thalassomonas sp. M1454]